MAHHFFMSKYESQVTKETLIAATKSNNRLFRNNTGTGWAGKSHRFTEIKTITVMPGDMLIRNARPLKAGLAKGSSDTIGWTNVEITPEMVGKTIPVFTAVEIKTRGTRTTANQKNWADYINKENGIALIIKESEEYEEGIKEWKKKQATN